MFLCLDMFGGRCSRQDPNVDACLLRSFNSLAEYLKGGAPELGIEEAEPIVIDELSIALGGGPDGYRATFKDIHATGVSNMTITNVRSDLESHQFQLTLFGPHISARARYRSSGVLLLVRASGGGDYWGEYEAALNLFINTNAQELLKEMKPELKRDLADKMSRFLARILDHIPYDDWIVD
ncbi:hypothetical protein MSG28_000566 [Choristoneura fumiferana]|uniref:Uncharacterized protein n=1 Tax=Choristoneura fumiferana TaxID=7141 RepID=A0ACC0K1A2_CHOFU|nr:hypothetical protein MSG28_000566 [Choristoneura fumiferana]